MRYWDLSLATPAENLACDEALLDFCEAGGCGELLRFWEPAQYSVVVGYANRAAREVNLEYCRRHGIPVLRRCTGGGTVIQGPGCLNYSLFLRISPDGPLGSIHTTNEFILQRHGVALSALLGKKVEHQGHTDLAVGGLKFSGNAQRRKKEFLIFHGSFLLGLDIGLIEKTLPMPSQQPDYRADRSHGEFLTNLATDPGRIKSTLREAWKASEPPPPLPMERIAELTLSKYSRDEWNLKF